MAPSRASPNLPSSPTIGPSTPPRQSGPMRFSDDSPILVRADPHEGSPTSGTKRPLNAISHPGAKRPRVDSAFFKSRTSPPRDIGREYSPKGKERERYGAVLKRKEKLQEAKGLQPKRSNIHYLLNETNVSPKKAFRSRNEEEDLRDSINRLRAKMSGRAGLGALGGNSQSGNGAGSPMPLAGETVTGVDDADVPPGNISEQTMDDPEPQIVTGASNVDVPALDGPQEAMPDAEAEPALDDESGSGAPPGGEAPNGDVRPADFVEETVGPSEAPSVPVENPTGRPIPTSGRPHSDLANRNAFYDGLNATLMRQGNIVTDWIEIIVFMARFNVTINPAADSPEYIQRELQDPRSRTWADLDEWFCTWDEPTPQYNDLTAREKYLLAKFADIPPLPQTFVETWTDPEWFAAQMATVPPIPEGIATERWTEPEDIAELLASIPPTPQGFPSAPSQRVENNDAGSNDGDSEATEHTGSVQEYPTSERREYNDSGPDNNDDEVMAETDGTQEAPPSQRVENDDAGSDNGNDELMEETGGTEEFPLSQRAEDGDAGSDDGDDEVMVETGRVQEVIDDRPWSTPQQHEGPPSLHTAVAEPLNGANDVNGNGPTDLSNADNAIASAIDFINRMNEEMRDYEGSLPDTDIPGSPPYIPVSPPPPSITPQSPLSPGDEPRSPSTPRFVPRSPSPVPSAQHLNDARAAGHQHAQVRGGFGPPVDVNTAFYFPHDHELYNEYYGNPGSGGEDSSSEHNSDSTRHRDVPAQSGARISRPPRPNSSSQPDSTIEEPNPFGPPVSLTRAFYFSTDDPRFDELIGTAASSSPLPPTATSPHNEASSAEGPPPRSQTRARRVTLENSPPGSYPPSSPPADRQQQPERKRKRQSRNHEGEEEDNEENARTKRVRASESAQSAAQRTPLGILSLRNLRNRFYRLRRTMRR